MTDNADLGIAITAAIFGSGGLPVK